MSFKRAWHPPGNNPRVLPTRLDMAINKNYVNWAASQNQLRMAIHMITQYREWRKDIVERFGSRLP